MNQIMLNNRHQQVLYDKKWKKFLRRAWLFRYLPFVEFALGAGSMATGDVLADSDFDVIVGVRRGRIFSARFFAVLAFGVFGWRRTRFSHSESARDKICLNHFVTDKAFRLAGPHTQSWRELYENLVPIYGPIDGVRAFFAANADWTHEAREFTDDLRYRYPEPSSAKIFFETILMGVCGDVTEAVFRYLQIKKIERSLQENPLGYKPRIIYSDDELEFHPDRAKFEE